MELSLEALCGLEGDDLDWPFRSYQTVTSARTGLKMIAQILKASGGGPVLLPAYLCSSMIQPFREAGVPVDYYKVSRNLTIDLNDLNRLVEDVRPSGLLFVNYFGFPVNKQEAKTLSQTKERCWVIEDCAQGSLIEQGSPVVGAIGHFALTSFRKYLPVPDGGLLINNTDMVLPQLPPASGSFVRRKLLGRLLRHEYFHGGMADPELEQAYLTLFNSAEKELDIQIPLHAMSSVAGRILGKIDLPSVMGQRRRNYAFLLRAFAENPQLQAIGTPILNSLPSGVSPLVFPLRVSSERRDGLRRKLVNLRVFCPVHWPWPAAIADDHFDDHFKEERDLSDHMLGLPIDQRYDEADMRSMIDRLLQAWELIR